MLIDGGFHMVYRHLTYLESLGSPQWVQADAGQLNIRRDGAPAPDRGEDFVFATVGFDVPLRIHWAHGWTLPAPVVRGRQSFLAGSEGVLELTDDNQAPLVIVRPEGSREQLLIPAGPRTNSDTTKACLLDYLDCLAHGREPHGGSAALARTTLAVILAAYESARSGLRVMLPH